MNDANEDTWTCWDESGWEIEVEAETAQEAAQEYVDSGDWANKKNTSVHKIYVNCGGSTEVLYISVDPEVPECDEDSHNWVEPQELLNGPKGESGVRGHGGGVVITTVCKNCGMYCDEDTWAQNPHTGVQGGDSTTYRSADETSVSWVG